MGDRRIELIAGQSSITLDGANIEFKTPGAFTVKGSGHAFLGGESGAANVESLPDRTVALEPPPQSLFVKYDEQVVFKDSLAVPVEGRLRFTVANKSQSSQSVQGESPALGQTERLDTDEAQPLEPSLRYAKFKFE
jgi:type VI secretion system secreted protein VgrG